MKVIFLDVDGVLNDMLGQKPSTVTWSQIITARNNNASEEEINKLFFLSSTDEYHSDKVELLEKLVQKTGAKVVISSSRRNNFEKVKEILKFKGFSGDIIDKTPILPKANRTVPEIDRCVEVKLWIDNWIVLNKEPLESIAILDDYNLKDNNDTGRLTNWHVHTSGGVGLTEKDAQFAEYLLTKGELKICFECKLITNWWTDFFQDNKLVKVLCTDCVHKKDIQEYHENKILRSNLLLRAILNKEPKELFDANEAIQAEVAAFDKEVWFAGLSDMINASKCSGMRAKVKGITILTYVMAGRVMITLEKGNYSISLIQAEKEPDTKMGWQGVYATKECALDLMKTVREQWKLGKIKLKDDTKVGLGF